MSHKYLYAFQKLNKKHYHHGVFKAIRLISRQQVGNIEEKKAVL